MEKIRVGIVGTGLQARRRLPAIEKHQCCKVEAIAGIEEHETEVLADLYKATALKNWEQIADNRAIDCVVICTPPHMHLEIAKRALEAGKHVLCEKPLTMRSEDAQRITEIAKQQGKVLKCGFNHRYHPAMQKAYEIVSKGEIGRPVTGRALYGICGREGCEKEWRSDPKCVSGGQLMEQGIHVIDLFRWFIGEFDAVSADVATHVFSIEPFEDTATLLLHRKDGVAVTVHSSITQWRNRFRFELYGTEGYIEVKGLGGSYDLQRLHIGKRDPNAPFTETVIDYRGSDQSWKAEWDHFMEGVLKGEPLTGTGEDGVKAGYIVEQAYVAAREGRRIMLRGENI